MIEGVWRSLCGAEGQYRSGEAIAKAAGRSRVAVWKAIQALERLGYRIDARAGRGYRLLAAPNRPLPWEIHAALPRRLQARRIEFAEELASTQDAATALAERGAAEGTVVVAERQRRGRGRLGRAWSSPAGGLWLSVILRPRVPPPQLLPLQLAAALAVVQALRLQLDVDAWIKWPNDVYVGQRKVCGILVEAALELDRVRHAIVGIGVNVNFSHTALPPEVRTTTTTLRDELQREIPLAPLAAAILQQLERWYRGLGGPRHSAVLRAIRQHSGLLGQRVRVVQAGASFEAEAVDVDPLGHLVVAQADGSRRTVSTGEVSLQR